MSKLYVANGEIKFNFDWKDMEELLDWHRDNANEAMANGQAQGRRADYWYGANEALGSVALMLWPREYNKYVFTKILPLVGDEEGKANE